MFIGSIQCLMAQGELSRAGEQIQIYEECETEFSPVRIFYLWFLKILIFFEMFVFLNILNFLYLKIIIITINYNWYGME